MEGHDFTINTLEMPLSYYEHIYFVSPIYEV